MKEIIEYHEKELVKTRILIYEHCRKGCNFREAYYEELKRIERMQEHTIAMINFYKRHINGKD